MHFNGLARWIAAVTLGAAGFTSNPFLNQEQQ